ncbi:MAG: T9SS type A sorting domain-containing protein, partial [Psychroflexus sp.]
GLDNSQGSLNFNDATLVIGSGGANASSTDDFIFNTNDAVKHVILNKTEGITTVSEGHLGITETLKLESGTLTAGDKITLLNPNENEVAYVIESTSGSANVSVEKYYTAKRSFRFVASPVDGGSIFENWQEDGNAPGGFGTHITGSTAGENGLDATETGNPSLFDYDNVSQNWSAVTNTNVENLVTGKAYRLYVRGDRNIDLTNNDAENETTLRATGSLKVGTVLVDNLGETENDFSFIGNPYQATVDVSSITFNNVNDDYYWVWDPNMNDDGSYVVVDLSDGSNAGTSQANQYLQPGQAAFVRTSANGPASVTFTEASKNVDQLSNAVFSNSEKPKLNLRLYESSVLQNGEMEFDAIGIRFSSNWTNEVDHQDARKMGNPAENLARLNGDDFLSIEKREMPQDGEELNLAIYNYEHSNYTFEADLSNFSENIVVYLNDSYTGSQSVLENGINHIDFTVDASIPESVEMLRFTLSFENTTLGTSNENFENFSVYPNPVTNQEFTIQTSRMSGEDVSLKLFNISGQSVMNQKLKIGDDGRLNIQTNGLSAGIYILELTQAQQTFKEKLIIK